MEKGLLLLNLMIAGLNSMLFMVIISYLKIDVVELKKHNKEKNNV